MDIAITQDPDTGAFRLILNALGNDLESDAGLTTAVVYSIFTDRRANADDAIPDGGTDRRGSWQDAYLPDAGDLEGARLWLLAREKTLPDVLARARHYAEEALAWLIADGIAARVAVDAQWSTTRRGWLMLPVTIDRASGGRYQQTFNATLQAA
jgi:phage gp46-like protein